MGTLARVLGVGDRAHPGVSEVDTNRFWVRPASKLTAKTRGRSFKKRSNKNERSNEPCGTRKGIVADDERLLPTWTRYVGI